MKPAVRILRKAASLIADSPHLAKRVRKDAFGCFCLIGAVQAANDIEYSHRDATDDSRLKAESLKEHDTRMMTGLVGKFLGMSGDVRPRDWLGHKGLSNMCSRAVEWNNRPETKQSEVVQALLATADAIEEGRLDGR